MNFFLMYIMIESKIRIYLEPIRKFLQFGGMCLQVGKKSKCAIFWLVDLVLFEF